MAATQEDAVGAASAPSSETQLLAQLTGISDAKLHEMEAATFADLASITDGEFQSFEERGVVRRRQNGKLGIVHVGNWSQWGQLP